MVARACAGFWDAGGAPGPEPYTNVAGSLLNLSKTICFLFPVFFLGGEYALRTPLYLKLFKLEISCISVIFL